MNKLKIKLKMNTTKFIKGNWPKSTQRNVNLRKGLGFTWCRASGVTIESILNLLV